MPIPPFITHLRAQIGNTPLWLSGVTAVVTRGDDVLMVKRADTFEWTPVSGIVDPGEQPAIAARREVLEEADLEVTVDRLASVDVSKEIVYENGDRAQYLNLTFRCTWVSGEPHPADGENVAAAWFPRDALPPMPAHAAQRILAALSADVAAQFVS